jgi:PAS domain S-box-containing protein
MLFPDTFDYRLIIRFQKFRHKPVATYGIALLAVALATFVRWIAGEQSMQSIPFITYFLAVVIAALFGGFWPGILATICSSIGAWYFFVSSSHGWGLSHEQTVASLLFNFESCLIVGSLAMLDLAVERVVEQEQNQRLLIESSPNGIAVIDRWGKIKRVNSKTERLFGYEHDELLGKPFEDLAPEPKLVSFWKPAAGPMGGGPELCGRRKNGGEFAVEIGFTPLGRNGAVLATITDISERKRLQDYEKLLSRELEHRTRNLFSLILAIINRSLSSDRTVAEAKEILSGRVHALSRARAMLANRLWESAPMREVIVQEFEGFPAQLTIAGCDNRINARAAQALALIIHELATNAIKFGALSVPDGHVSIEGRIEHVDGEDVFRLVWRERSGPPVAQKRKGFGSYVLLESVKQFDGKAKLDFNPSGLIYELQLPVKSIEPPAERGPAALRDVLSELRLPTRSDVEAISQQPR